MGLLDPERSLTISSAVWIQYQWCRSVVKSEGVRVTSHSLRSSHQTKSRPKFVFGSENGLFGRFRFFFHFRSKMNFLLCFIFRFRSKNVICVRPKTLCSQLYRITKLCDIGTGDIRFRPITEFHFRRHFRLRPKMRNISPFGLYIKLFQLSEFRLHPTSMIFKHSTIPVPDSL